MDIPQKIEEIITKRKQQLPKIEGAIERIEAAKATVDRLETFRGGASETIQAMMKANQDFSLKLESISSTAFNEAYENAMAILKQLRRRFEREQVFISFVGKAGQGKSLVLQQISGLDGAIIPSAEGSDCTGARSIISNRAGVPTSAEITFLTERELADKVNAYLGKIFKTTRYDVSSVEGIKRLQKRIGEIEAEAGLNVMDTAYMEHLRKYIDHVADFERDLGTRKTVAEADIEQYVAQYKRDDPSVKYYAYLAVKEANIFSEFPCGQCGRLVLLDTIGTGATSLGVEAEMLSTVREDSDAIVLMMRPETLRPRVDADDCATIENISNSVSREYAQEMLFVAVNKVETEKANNVAKIPDFIRQLQSQKLPVAQILEVNCGKQEEVESRLLLPVLEQMAGHLQEIDQMILDRANLNQLKELEKAYKGISGKVEGAVSASINQDERRHFEQDIQDTIDAMTNEIRNLYLRYGSLREEPVPELEDQANAKLKNILLSIPSKDVIIKKLNQGRKTQHDVLFDLTDSIRIGIINDFLGLNVTLRNLVQNMKKEVVHLLADPEIGRLGAVVGANPDDPDPWLKGLLEKLDAPQYQMLHKAFEPLSAFDLRMENFQIYKVRSCLDNIDWSLTKGTPQLNADNFDKDGMAEEIKFWLEHSLETVHAKVRSALKGYYAFPNEAFFAVVRDFHDRIVYAGDKNIDTEWRYLYEDKIPMIWAERHRAFMVAAGTAEEWNDVTAKVHACAADGYFMVK